MPNLTGSHQQIGSKGHVVLTLAGLEPENEKLMMKVPITPCDCNTHTDIVRVQSHRLTYRMKMLALTQIDGDESENGVHVKFSLV